MVVASREKWARAGDNLHLNSRLIADRGVELAGSAGACYLLGVGPHRGALPVDQVACIIRVSVTHESEVTMLGVPKTKIVCPLQVADDALDVLHMGFTWIRLETSGKANCKNNVRA